MWILWISLTQLVYTEYLYNWISITQLNSNLEVFLNILHSKIERSTKISTRKLCSLYAASLKKCSKQTNENTELHCKWKCSKVHDVIQWRMTLHCNSHDTMKSESNIQTSLDC